MRIIAGEHRGRRLAAPPGSGTRPMLDRVRVALFDTLGARPEDGRVLDLFAGSGSLGLEALSRGAVFARLVERDPGALAALRRNVELLGLTGCAEILRGDALAESAWIPPDEGSPPAWVDVCFLDPPYPWLRDERRGALFAALRRLALEILTPDGVLVLHAPKRAVTEVDFGPGLALRQRSYGSSCLWYVEPEEGAA